MVAVLLVFKANSSLDPNSGRYTTVPPPPRYGAAVLGGGPVPETNPTDPGGGTAGESSVCGREGFDETGGAAEVSKSSHPGRHRAAPLPGRRPTLSIILNASIKHNAAFALVN
jgi:hypothetical protein